MTPDPEACTADVSQRRSRIISAQLAPHDARLLLQRCKAEGTTVTGEGLINQPQWDSRRPLGVTHLSA